MGKGKHIAWGWVLVFFVLLALYHPHYALPIYAITGIVGWLIIKVFWDALS